MLSRTTCLCFIAAGLLAFPRGLEAQIPPARRDSTDRVADLLTLQLFIDREFDRAKRETAEKRFLQAYGWAIESDSGFAGKYRDFAKFAAVGGLLAEAMWSPEAIPGATRRALLLNVVEALPTDYDLELDQVMPLRYMRCGTGSMNHDPLVNVGKFEPLLVRRLLLANSNRQEALLELYMEVDPAAATLLLPKYLASSRSAVRAKALYFQMRSPKAVKLELLRMMSRDDTAQVRYLVLEVLSRRDPEESLPLARELLKDENKEVRAFAEGTVSRLSSVRPPTF